MSKLELLNSQVKSKGYYITRKTSSKYELHISQIVTRIHGISGLPVYTSKNLKDMENFIGKNILTLDDIDTNKKYKCLHGIVTSID